MSAPAIERPDRAPRAAATRRRATSALQTYPWLFALVLVVGLTAANVIARDSFLGKDHLIAMLGTLAPFVLVAFASTPQILAGRGGIDISMGPLMTLVNCVIVVKLLPNGWDSPVVLVPIVVAIGAAAGLLNGLLVVVGRLQSVVATLATFFVFSGLALKVAPIPETAGDNWTKNLGDTVGPVPGGLVMILVGAAIWFALHRADYIRRIRVVGGDDVAAFSAGINVAAIRVGAYVLGGVFAALGGLALTGVIQTAQASLAPTYSLIALAAVSLGGTSLLGGRGGILGSFLGATAIYLMQELLGAMGVPVSYVQFMYGLLLVGGVVLSGLTMRAGATR